MPHIAEEIFKNMFVFCFNTQSVMKEWKWIIADNIHCREDNEKRPSGEITDHKIYRNHTMFGKSIYNRNDMRANTSVNCLLKMFSCYLNISSLA